MTIKEAREELRSYQQKLKIRKNRSQKVEELRELLGNCKISKYGTGGAAGRNPYRLEELIDKIIKAENQYIETVSESVEIMAQIENKIERLSGRHYTVLRKKYIEGKSYELIAVEEHYVYEYVRQLENQGVALYAKV